ncbi:MAG: hypothetical protein WCH34_04905 [Bacteroidota bacterium]
MPFGDHEYRCVLKLNMPGPIESYETWAGGIYLSMHNNTRYASLSPKLATLLSNNSALDVAQKGYKAKPPTVSRAVRDAALKSSKNSIYILADNVQEMADDDPENAEAIITEAGFGVKKIPIQQKRKNSAEQGSEPKSVNVWAEGKGMHNWRMSTDGITWVILLASKGQKKVVKNLTSLTTYHFQHSPVLIDGEEGSWSETISIRVA